MPLSTFLPLAGRTHILSRMGNALRCYSSYALSLFGSVRIVHAPLFVSVEPANRCQLRCPECPVGQTVNPSSGPGLMSREIWEKVLQQAAPYAHTIQFYFQGEPLLNKDLPRMIGEAHAEGLYTIVSTNAQAMTESMAEALVGAGLNRIIISMDGLTQDTYSSYRVGGEITRCHQALAWLREAKKRLHAHITIELQCLRLRTNEHEWKTIRQEYKRLGADRLTMKTAQLYNYQNGHPLMPTDERYSRYTKGTDGVYHLKPRGKGCLRVWSGCVVTTGGEVLPCCYDKAHAHAYGNILTTPLRELFSSAKADAFRRAALTETPDICQQCWK